MAANQSGIIDRGSSLPGGALDPQWIDRPAHACRPEGITAEWDYRNLEFSSESIIVDTRELHCAMSFGRTVSLAFDEAAS
jgi:hypothetical protein